MKIRQAVAVAAITATLALGPPALAPALANDSTAELGAGGLVLKKTDAIEMRSEDLSISQDEVRVRYVFRNTSPRDVTTTVAFPMPDIVIEGYDDMLSIPTDDPQNILGFSTLIDGKPVHALVEQHAVQKGVDYTAYLKGLGIPLAAHLDSTADVVERLPPARRAELVAKGLAIVDEYDAGKGMEKHWRPTWTLKTAYHWDQTFPAGRDLIVEHRYKPSVGESSGTSVGSPASAGSDDLRAITKLYCMDAAFSAAVRKGMTSAKQEWPPYTEARIEYVLTTGANWKKPIGDFHLTVDKGAPENLISFCETGVVKTGPTRFEVRHKGFTPRRDLAILILKPLKPQP